MASHAMLTDMMVHRKLMQQDWTKRAGVKVHVMLVINDELARVDHLFEAAREMGWTVTNYRNPAGLLEVAILPTTNILEGIQIWRGIQRTQIVPKGGNSDDSV